MLGTLYSHSDIDESQEVSSLLFSQKHNIILTTEGDNSSRVLIVDPETGSLIQNIDLLDFGNICLLGLCSDQIVMLHEDDSSQFKISYFNLVG